MNPAPKRPSFTGNFNSPGWAPLRAWLAFALGAAASASAAPFTVVSFGDSTTAPRRNVETYTAQLEARFRSAGGAVRFINRGVPDDNTDRACARLATDVLARRPNLVIVQFGLNDSAVDVWKNPPAREPRVPLERYAANLRHIVGEIRRVGAEPVLMTPNQVRWTDTFRRLYHRPPYDVRDERGLTRPAVPYVEAVRRIASDLRVPLVDVYAAYDAWERRHGESCRALTVDGEHPNTAGQALVADALAPLIEAALRRQKPTSGIQRPSQ